MLTFEPLSVRAQIDAIMRGMGADDHARTICTQIMFDTDLMGVDSHGISMLAYYAKEAAGGRMDPTATPVIERDFGAVALIDGKRGLGHTAAHLGMATAIEKAKSLGVGLVSVHNTTHFGAAGYYARMAADTGLVGLVLCSTVNALQIPHGARLPLMGTNPIGFAAPVPGENPLLVDMSTSVVPLNKVKVYGLKGEDLPGEWVADQDGRVLNDAAEVYRQLEDSQGGGIGLLPLGGATFNGGGHKGSALATMIQVLSAALSGADQPGNVDGFQSIGAFFLAIEPEAINPGGGAGEYVRQLRDTIRGMTPVDPQEPVQATGDRDFETRAWREAHGIPLADALVTQVRELSARLGVEFTLREQV